MVLLGREHLENLRERDAPLADRCTLLAAVTLESMLRGKLFEKVFTITGTHLRREKHAHLAQCILTISAVGCGACCPDLLCDSNIANLRQWIVQSSTSRPRQHSPARRPTSTSLHVR